ncbi:MAG TPA: DUF2017 domain-containing protein [Ornithinicoccus sp.]|nr:DUF2017 domain-containing protein [Ornithinicoccus sp.]
MATEFRRKGQRVVATMEPEELEVVVQLLTLTRDFVAPERDESGDPFLDLVAGMGGSADPSEPEDPALRRLLPPASRTDPEQAAEFRRLTEHTLRQRKAATLSTAIEALTAADPPKVDLDLDQARALSVGLADVRLVLGERLGLRTDEDSDRLHERLERALAGEEEVDPGLFQQMAYYDFLTWLQESVTLALLR